MSYVNNIWNMKDGFKSLCGFGNMFICSDGINSAKTVTFPDGYDNDSNITFRVLFQNGHNCTDDNTHLALNDIAVVVNKYGTLIPLPIHEMTENGNTVYKSLQPNTILDLYYTSNYDGNNTEGYVVIGNPIVLSSSEYTIYADGKIGNESVGDYKAISTNTIPYGWLLCDGSAVSRTTYSDLYNLFVRDNTLEVYGTGDGSTTFNLPDLREVLLRGTGTSTRTEGNHNTMTLGQFQDDALQNHTHSIHAGKQSGLSYHGDYHYLYDNENDTSNASGRTDTTTHDKSIGVNYIIKY